MRRRSDYSDMPVPQVSVIIPTRNRHVWLARALRSVHGQTGVSCEVIVVDDGSTPPVPEQEGISVIRREDPGNVAAARNLGLQASTAPWVAFLDDDDLWSPTKLAAQVAAANAAGADAVYGSAIVVDAAGAVLGMDDGVAWSDDVIVALLRANVVPGGCSNLIARRATVAGVGGFDPTFSILADWDLHIRLAQAGRITRISDAVVAYTVHGGNLHRDASAAAGERERLEHKHATAYSAHRVAVDPAWWLGWQLGVLLADGRGRAAAAVATRLGLRQRDPRKLALGAALVVGGRRAARTLRKRARNGSPVAAPGWLSAQPPPREAVR